MFAEELQQIIAQIIAQSPDHEFSYTYETGIRFLFRHGNLWSVERTGPGQRPVRYQAQAFDEIYNAICLYGETDQTKEELLTAANEQLATLSH